ncbi:MAG TPA: LPS assembly protein LptD [Rhizomicrobium sp.]|nr:LPS assembly protein LptD [Rhizomicrobium sp.]
MKGGVSLLPLIMAAMLLPTGAAAETVATGSDDNQMLLQADEATYDVDRKVARANGHVEIDYGGRILVADQVVYDENTDKVTAEGHVSIMQANGDVAFANHVELTDRMRDGALSGFSALIGKTGRVVASTATRQTGVQTTAYNAAYTPCEICRKRGDKNPLWSVHAYRVIYDEAKHKIRFKNATVEFFGIPVLYTPYYSLSDPTVKHATGILTPEIGNSSSIGYFAKVPIYFAFSDSQDFTLTPFVTTKGGEVLEGEYRQRWNNGGMWLQASGAYNPNGGLSGTVPQGYAHVFGAGDWAIDQHWRAGYDVQLTNNDTYLKRYDISQLDRLVNDVFIEGIAGRNRFALTGYYFEGLRATDSSQLIPYALPMIEYTYMPDHKILRGQWRLDLNSVSLFRQQETPDLPNADERVTAELRYRVPLVTNNGQMITFEADARGDLYHVGHFASGVASSGKFVGRGLPYVALDWRWPFVNGGRGNAFVITPIVQAVWSPEGGHPASIPNEDSTAFEFSDQNLFTFDRLPGFDVVDTGARANIGLKANAYFSSGQVEAVLGEVLRAKPNPIFSADSGLSGTASDLVGRLSVQFLPYLDLTHRIDIDKNSGSVRRNEVFLTGIWGRSTMQVSYLNLSAQPSQGLAAREEANAQLTLGVFKYWELFGAARRDLLAGKMLDSEFGLGYEDECLGIAIAYRRRYTTDRDLPKSTAVLLRFTLKTGDEPYEPFSLFPKDVFSRP